MSGSATSQNIDFLSYGFASGYKNALPTLISSQFSSLSTISGLLTKQTKSAHHSKPSDIDERHSQFQSSRSWCLSKSIMEIAKITTPKDWVYFAKGSANILFKYIGSHDFLKDKLLRIRLAKETAEYISTCELYDFVELKCKPLFADSFIDAQLIVLEQQFLAQLDLRGNKIMTLERYGLLTPNVLNGDYIRHLLSKHCQLYIGTQEPLQQVIFEIKPKWLYDNNQTNYCRTCLLNQLRDHPRHFCPLDLLYEDTINKGLSDLFAPIPDEVLSQLDKEKFPVKELFEAFLRKPDNVFLKLKRYQKTNDPSAELMQLQLSKDVSIDLSLIMTLRDVGVFIKFERYNDESGLQSHKHMGDNIVSMDEYGKFLITCNIYDLDLKSQMKFKYWQSIEVKLGPIYNSSNPNWIPCVKHSD